MKSLLAGIVRSPGNEDHHRNSWLGDHTEGAGYAFGVRNNLLQDTELLILITSRQRARMPQRRRPARSMRAAGRARRPRGCRWAPYVPLAPQARASTELATANDRGGTTAESMTAACRGRYLAARARQPISGQQPPVQPPPEQPNQENPPHDLRHRPVFLESTDRLFARNVAKERAEYVSSSGSGSRTPQWVDRCGAPPLRRWRSVYSAG